MNKVTCTEALEWISAALDGELAPGEEQALGTHLKACEPCSRLAEDFKVNRLLVNAMAAHKAPSDGWSRLRNRLAALDESPEMFGLPPGPSKTGQGVSSGPWSRRVPVSRSVRLVTRSAAGLVLAFTGLLLWLGYTDPDVAAQPSTSTLVTVEASSLLRGHAVMQASNPMADRAAWSSLACSSGWTLHPEVVDEGRSSHAPSFGPIENDADLL